MKQWTQWECIEWLLGRQVFVEFAPGDDCVTLCVRAGRLSNGVYSERYKAEHNEKLSALRRAVHDLSKHDNTPCPIERCAYCKPEPAYWESKPVAEMTIRELQETIEKIDPECCLHTIPVVDGGWNAQIYGFSNAAASPHFDGDQRQASILAVRWFATCREVYNDSTDTVRIPQEETA